MADYPHFELNATDYGYSSLQEAYQVNKRDYQKAGGARGLPTMTFDKEKKKVTINGKEYEAVQLTKDEAQAIINYLKEMDKKKR